jgi:actin
MWGDEMLALVIDNGSGMCKAGFADEEAPRSVFPSIVGRPKDVSRHRANDVYIGDEVCAKAGDLIAHNPLENGMVTHWIDMERIWHRIFFNELHVDPSKHPVLLIDAPLNPKAQREQIGQIMFETFNVPSLYFEIPALLDLFGSGRTTGIVVDIGDTVTQIVPIYEGHKLSFAMRRQNLGGRILANWLASLLTERGFYASSFLEREIVRDMKEKCTYVALDFDAEMQKAAPIRGLEISYRPRRGSLIEIATERFRCPDLLFRPRLNGLEFTGIHKLVFGCINKSGVDLDKDLYRNIVLAGGSTMFPGFPERLEKEIVDRAPVRTNVKVIAPPERKYSAWIGGSILASLATFPQLVITHEEYNEHGPSIIHRKCF